MKEGLQAVHRGFLAAVAIPVLGLAVVFPRLADGPRARALRLLDVVAAELDTRALEATLRRQAEASAAPTLADVARKVAGVGVSGLSGSRGRPALFQARPLRLDTLAQVATYAGGAGEVRVVGPDVDALATGLRWRLARLGAADGAVLRALELAPGSASRRQLSTEAQVEPARVAAVEARRRYVEARKRFLAYRDRVKALKARGAPRKVQWGVIEKRRLAYEEKEASKQAREQTRTRYDQLAEAALAFRPRRASERAAGVVVQASVERPGEGTQRLRVPAPRVTRAVRAAAVSLPPSFEKLRADPAWTELADLGVEGAQQRMRRGLSWQMAGRDLGPLRVGGPTVLQLFPGIVMLALWSLGRRVRVTAESYDPFHHPGRDLPTPGTGRLSLDAALLVGPTALLACLVVWALARIQAQAWLGLLVGVAAVVHAGLVARAWARLLELRGDILRTSIHPPPPAP